MINKRRTELVEEKFIVSKVSWSEFTFPAFPPTLLLVPSHESLGLSSATTLTPLTPPILSYPSPNLSFSTPIALPLTPPSRPCQASRIYTSSFYSTNNTIMYILQHLFPPYLLLYLPFPTSFYLLPLTFLLQCGLAIGISTLHPSRSFLMVVGFGSSIFLLPLLPPNTPHSSFLPCFAAGPVCTLKYLYRLVSLIPIPPCASIQP